MIQKIKKSVLLILLVSVQVFSQDDDKRSNIQTFTPSVLLSKGQWDIKFFNGLYTQTKQTDAGSRSRTIQRENFVIKFKSSFLLRTQVHFGSSEEIPHFWRCRLTLCPVRCTFAGLR